MFAPVTISPSTDSIAQPTLNREYGAYAESAAARARSTRGSWAMAPDDSASRSKEKGAAASRDGITVQRRGFDAGGGSGIVASKRDPGLFWDRANWQSMCKSCHDAKTAREGRWG